MLSWIMSNLSTIIISIVLIVIVALVIVKMVMDKKKGKGGSCGCGCSSCPMSGKCHQKSKENGNIEN